MSTAIRRTKSNSLRLDDEHHLSRGNMAHLQIYAFHNRSKRERTDLLTKVTTVLSVLHGSQEGLLRTAILMVRPASNSYRRVRGTSFAVRDRPKNGSELELYGKHRD